MVQFTTWIWDLLPEYFHRNDSYKDTNDQGLLERYLKNYGQELDQQFIPFMDGLLDLLDAAACDAKYLPYLSFMMGSPISIDGDTNTYRNIIRYAAAIYKIKGTEQSYKLLFNLIGIDVKILEEMPNRALTYDSGHFYDEAPALQHYDQECDACSYYTIAYNSIDDTTNPININNISPGLLAKFTNIICFLQPINAKLRGYMKRIVFIEDMNLTLTDEIFFDRDATTPFDEGFDHGFDSP